MMDDCGREPDGMWTPRRPSLSSSIALLKICGNFYHGLVSINSCGIKCKSRGTCSMGAERGYKNVHRWINSCNICQFWHVRK